MAKLSRCVYQQKFKVLADSLNKAIKIDSLKRDRYTVRAICRLTELSITLIDSSKGGIPMSEKLQLEKNCTICCEYGYYKNKKCCEPPIPEPLPLSQLDSTKYTVWEISASGYGINAHLASPIRNFDNKFSLGGTSVGLQYVYGTKLGELKAGLMYAYDRFEVQSMTVSQNKANIDQIEFDFIRVPISIVIPLGGPKRRANQVYPFAELGVIPQISIKYNHFQTLNQVTTNDTKLLYGLNIAYHLSLGLQVKRLSISAFYNSSGTVFASSATAPPLNLTNSAYTTVGFNLGYRFAFKHNVR